MIMHVFSNEIISKAINSAIAVIFVGIISIITIFILRKRYSDKRQKQKLKSRVCYISIIVFVLLLIRIWVEGFTHLFAMLSLLAASIVVTNKESIMNVTGFLIINWRGIFSVGDLVQIQNVIGYVEAIKLFNFKVLETANFNETMATGKTIKVPNSFVITNSVVILPSENALLLHKVEKPIAANGNIKNLMQKALDLLNSVIDDTYKEDSSYTLNNIKRSNPKLGSMIDLKPTVELRAIAGNNDSMLLVMVFYCYPKDYSAIEQSLYVSMLDIIK